MKKVRVIHCLGQLNTGGAETLVINILRNIDRDRYQFDFLLFSDIKGFYDDEVINYGSKLYYTPNTRQGLLKYIKSMIGFFKQEKVEIVHAHMDWQCGFIAYAAHKAGVKNIIVHSHANQNMFKTTVLHKLLIRLNEYLIHKYATVRLACSKEAGESLFHNDSFEILVNGIDMKRYLHPDVKLIKKLKSEFKLEDRDIVLGHVGSFSLNKNQSFLIDVLDQLVKENKNYKLVLVGDGGTRNDIINKVNKLNLNKNVIFAGVRKEVPEIMHLFNLFLFPSIYEGLGIVAIEAQSCGLTCIVSNTIPTEIDMNMNLIHYIKLDVNQWVNVIKHNNIREIKDENQLKESKFNIENTSEMLYDIYCR